ncbi:Zn-dependent protease [Salirhabdus euzebyi]|uniref:Zn-dependent protease n=1 Tax=Salirhabdus euzebyi TaxID=394506 RepID=A0A841QA72_9BACI|nr:site-2 protease family protein [Salirhabdus euzebyi]MBB6455296.1 Zn-dependent protease [Salirhabdus euzebyi]
MEIFVVFLFLFAPISIILHEIGHAVSAWFLRADHINFSIGLGKRIYVKRSRKVQLIVHGLYFLGGQVSSERKVTFNPWEKVFISLGGPIVSGVVSVVLFFSGFVHTKLIMLFFLFNVWLFIINLIPFRVGHRKSDGYVCLEEIIQMIRLRK